MGNCVVKTPTPGSDDSNNNVDIEFFKDITLSISIKNHLGRIKSHSKISFKATAPIRQRSEIITLDRPMRVTGCIIPGLNPHGEEKICQDNYTFISSHNMLLCALFDGHGSVGEQVSEFCVDFTTRYFSSNAQTFQTSPKSALISLLEDCDASLRTTKIRYELSGSTAVVLLITSTSIHTASLGDSRAVLGTLANMSFSLPAPLNKYCRQYTVGRVLKPIPLTVDQKPNHDEEFMRIRKAGGQVDKVTDIMGNKLGPFRVWLPNSDLPGLAMSRSIGDGLAKSIGVIATPVYHFFTIYSDTDQYIVMASDGIWDVMENMEVVVFIEKFKEKCDNSHSTDVFPAGCQNSSIARMLCEEARYRWFGLIEAEDVNIDDISCIVIDISRNVSVKADGKKVERNVRAFQSLALDGYGGSEETAAEKIEEMKVESKGEISGMRLVEVKGGGSGGGKNEEDGGVVGKVGVENEVSESAGSFKGGFREDANGEEVEVDEREEMSKMNEENFEKVSEDEEIGCSYKIQQRNENFIEEISKDTEINMRSEQSDGGIDGNKVAEGKLQSTLIENFINERIEIFGQELLSKELIDNEEPMIVDVSHLNSHKIKTPEEENVLKEHRELIENEKLNESSHLLSEESTNSIANEKGEKIIEEKKELVNNETIDGAVEKILPENILIENPTGNEKIYSQRDGTIITETHSDTHITREPHTIVQREEEISKKDEDYKKINERDTLVSSPYIISKPNESYLVEESVIKIEADHIEILSEDIASSDLDGKIIENSSEPSKIIKE